MTTKRISGFLFKHLTDIVRKILIANSQHLNRDKIMKEIKDDLIKLKPQVHPDIADSVTYIHAIKSYLNYAARHREPEIEKAFNKIFFDDLKQDGGDFLTAYYALKVHGIYDLVALDDWLAAESATEERPMSSGAYKFVSDILSHAKYNMPVLIIGETGTSKEASARSICAISDRRNKPYIPVNCAAISEFLIESELFGHVKGAFTGASNNRKGFFESADGGIIFLDELGKTSRNFQNKLLRVIETKEIQKVGHEKSIKIDVKIIAAIQPADLDTILPDLKWRLRHPDSILMPTLNERLSSYQAFGISHSIFMNSLYVVLRQLCLDDDINISDGATRILGQYPYKGNYRELENILIRAVINAKDKDRKEILPEDLSLITEKNTLLKANTPEEVSYKNILLKDIFDYADEVAKNVSIEIVTNKLQDVIKKRGDFKKILTTEGVPEKYVKYQKKVNKYTGKMLTDFEGG